MCLRWPRCLCCGSKCRTCLVPIAVPDTPGCPRSMWWWEASGPSMRCLKKPRKACGVLASCCWEYHCMFTGSGKDGRLNHRPRIRKLQSLQQNQVMDFQSFELEHYQSQFEHTVDYNLADSSVQCANIRDLVSDAEAAELLKIGLYYPEVN